MPLPNLLVSGSPNQLVSNSFTQLTNKSSKVAAAADLEDDRGPPVLCGSFRADFAALCRDKGVLYVPNIVSNNVPEVKTESKKFARKMTMGRNMLEQDTKQFNRKNTLRAVSRWEQKAEGRRKATLRERSMSRVSSNCSNTLMFAECDNAKDRLDYFIPRVQVVQDVDNDDRTVREVSICGWKVDVVMMEVLEGCLPELTSLRVLRLWRVGLSGDTLAILARCLPLCRALTSVILDNNTLTDCPLHALLVHTAVLQTLSLRFCNVGDGGVMALARVLQEEGEGGTTAPLVSLLLTGNQVGDEGACSLALALTFNRVLRVLNLSANSVGDRGAAGLASACRWVRVTGDNLMSRRQRLHKYLVDHPSDLPKQASKTIRLQKRSAVHDRKLHKQHSRPARRITLTSRLSGRDGRKVARGVSSSHAAFSSVTMDSESGLGLPPPLKAPDTMWYKPGRRPDYFAESDIAVEGCGLHPLMQPGFLHDGDLWLPGNRSLLSLNLSRNKVGKVGVHSLMETLEEQAVPVAGGEPGLQRLVLHHNPFPPNCPAFLRISRRLRFRDSSNRTPRVDLCNIYITPCAIALV